MSSITKTTSAAISCRLLALPQELQDVIFSLAYPKQTLPDIVYYSGNIGGYKTRTQWNKSHPHRRHKQFPAKLNVDSFIVSKRWFCAASRAWVTNQHTWFWGSRNPAFALLGVEPVAGIVPAYLKKLYKQVKSVGGDGCLTGFGSFPALQSLRIMSNGEFPSSCKRLSTSIFCRSLNQEELEMLLNDFQVLSNVKLGVEVEITYAQSPKWDPKTLECISSEEWDQWRANLAALIELWRSRRAEKQQLLSIDRLLPVEVAQVGGEDIESESLYPSSKVYWHHDSVKGAGIQSRIKALGQGQVAGAVIGAMVKVRRALAARCLS